MRLYELAWKNVKNNIRNYFSLILSLAFTVMIFYNFQNMADSEVFTDLGKLNEDYSKMLIQTLSAVLGAFMIFFVGYATNVFLTRRKKEIGIFIFMGLTNQRIGRLYLLEMTMAGIVTLFVGIGFGILTTQLFQMILLAMSEIAVDIGFSFSIKSVRITSAFYIIVYAAFILKGYLNIVKSSVLELVSAGRKNESVRFGSVALVWKTIVGAGILSYGYLLAIKEGEEEILRNVTAAVVLVIVGVYFLFAGLIPAVFQGLARNKKFLYRKERNLWVSQVIFRMKKNYRTYAMVSVLMICSVTALSASFAWKNRYDSMLHFRTTYTYQLLSSRPDLNAAATRLISQKNEIAFSTSIPILMLSDEETSAGGHNTTSAPTALLAWSDIRRLAKDAGLNLDMKEPDTGTTIEITHLYLISLMTKRTNVPVQFGGRTFLKMDEVSEPYLGYLQETMSFYLVSDEAYASLLPLGRQLYAYNYQIKDPYNYKASADALGALVSDTESNYTARIITGPDSGRDREWIKILYSLCVFLVMVFIMASGSILFMKLYNDALEETGRYDILQKMGCSYQTLKRAVAKELLVSYALPLLVMGVSSYFSVSALENVMHTTLAQIRLVSVGLMAVFFYLCYRISLRVYLKNAGIRRY